jgi:hypothetical protein
LEQLLLLQWSNAAIEIAISNFSPEESEMSILSFILTLVLFVIQQQDDSVDIFVDITNVILTYQYNSNDFIMVKNM